MISLTIKALTEKGNIFLLENLLPKKRTEIIALKMSKINIQKISDNPLTFRIKCGLPVNFGMDMLMTGYIKHFEKFNLINKTDFIIEECD